MTQKRVVIAGTRSGVGKTTVSLALMTAFNSRGYKVQPFKVGPDYIDPGFHKKAADNLAYNLDSYFLSDTQLKDKFITKSEGADISIIEGVMGLFDGKGKNMTGSTASIAKKLDAPVILVVDAARVGQSIAALVYGYKNFDPDLKLDGVIINNVGSFRHYQIIKEIIESEPVNLKALGYLPRQQNLELPESHLGLIPAEDNPELKSYFKQLRELAEEHFELDKIYNLSGSKEKLTISGPDEINARFKGLKVGVARDQAFNFYYQSDLDLISEIGAEPVFISPLKDNKLPELDALIIGGGFPERYIKELAENISFKEDLKRKILAGLPVYAECGGLIYLSNQFIDTEDNKYQLTGLLDIQIKMTDKLQSMGYREVQALRDNLLLKKGQSARGHLFHYSKIANRAEEIPLNYKSGEKTFGYSFRDNLLASYFHINFSACPELLERFLMKAEEYNASKKR